LERNRSLRVVGFDDAPFDQVLGQRVGLAGIICSDTRFEGMVWGTVERDGRDATAEICRLLEHGKFLPQLHALLLDGVTVGGLNVVGLGELSRRLALPCVAVLRRAPDLQAFAAALGQFPDAEQRLRLLAEAGPIHQHRDFYYQVCGASPEQVAVLLDRITDRGQVPEPLRLAHLVGSAIVTGQSGRRA
jgi:endonuclease V-like protein UPF0215 family